MMLVVFCIQVLRSGVICALAAAMDRHAVAERMDRFIVFELKIDRLGVGPYPVQHPSFHHHSFG